MLNPCDQAVVHGTTRLRIFLHPIPSGQRESSICIFGVDVGALFIVVSSAANVRDFEEPVLDRLVDRQIPLIRVRSLAVGLDKGGRRTSSGQSGAKQFIDSEVKRLSNRGVVVTLNQI